MPHGSVLWYVSKGKNCSFERIFCRLKAIFRKLSGAKSREINVEMVETPPKVHFKEFRNTP